MRNYKEWFKKEIGKSILSRRFDKLKLDMNILEFEYLIDQLEEPEKPVQSVEEYFKNIEQSKEALEELGYVISEKNNINLIESKKPVIPQFVADYIEYYKGTGIKLGTWFNFTRKYEFERKTEEWTYSDSYEENLKREYLLVDAIRYGYKVEGEPQWIVKRSNGDYVDSFGSAWDCISINVTSSLDATAIHKFNDITVAKAVAVLVGGVVEEVQ